MNSNEHPDKHLLEHIEQALEQGQSAQDPLLNDLTQTLPQASSNFQQQLENQLIARLQTRQGETAMTTASFTPSVPTRKPVFFPLTLVAALVIMLLVGSILLSGNGKLPDPTSAVALQSETQTPAIDPTASPLIRIVVAYQNIPRGFHFPDTVEALQEIVGYAAWPLDSAPFTALSEDGGGLEQLAGKIARTDIFREQPILSNLLVDDPAHLASVGSDLALILPQNNVAITIPFTNVQSTSGDLVAGDYVNVIAAVLFVDVGKNFQGVSTPFMLTPSASGTAAAPQVMLQNIVKNALVVQIGAFPSDENTTPQPTIDAPLGDVITLAVSPDDATVLRWVVDSKIPLSLSQTIPAVSSLKPVVVARQFIPRGAQLTVDQLTIVYLNPDLVPQNALETVERAAGLYLSDPLEAWQPLVTSSAQKEPLFVERILPVNMVARGVPVTIISGMTPNLQNGDVVDITAHFLYPIWPDNALAFGPNTLPLSEVIPVGGGKVERGLVVQNLILKGVRIYNMGDINEPPGDNPLTITLAMTVEEAARLEWVTESTKPIAITLTREKESVDLHAETQPDGRISVQLPIQAARGVTVVNGTPVAPTSNHFDIFLSLDFTVQAADRPARTDAQDILQVIAPDAELLNSPEDIFVSNALLNATFLVAPEDLPKLEWAVKSGMLLGVSWRP